MKHQTRVSYKCAAVGCEYQSLQVADMKRHMALEHILVIKNADGTGKMTNRNAFMVILATYHCGSVIA